MDTLALCIIVLILIAVVVAYSHNKAYYTEDYTMSPADYEAVQNMASLYNTGNVTATNITTTGNVTAANIAATGKLTVSDALINATLTAGGDTTINGVLTATKPATISDIRLSKGWTNYPGSAPDHSEISNDVDQNKTLMIVGNTSAGGARRVGMWDDVTVNGNLTVTGKTNFKVFPGWQAFDGNDISSNNSINSFNQCVSFCDNDDNAKDHYLSVTWQPNTCYCKSSFGFKGKNPSFTTGLRIP
jgi:hypothetical protein